MPTVKPAHLATVWATVDTGKKRALTPQYYAHLTPQQLVASLQAHDLAPERAQANRRQQRVKIAELLALVQIAVNVSEEEEPMSFALKRANWIPEVTHICIGGTAIADRVDGEDLHVVLWTRCGLNGRRVLYKQGSLNRIPSYMLESLVNLENFIAGLVRLHIACTLVDPYCPASSSIALRLLGDAQKPDDRSPILGMQLRKRTFSKVKHLLYPKTTA